MAEFPTLSDIFEPIEGKSGTEANEQMRLWYTGTRQLPGASPSESITIADDVIAPTRADVIVDTEGQAPADDLQIIKTDSTHDGMILTLRTANASRAVTVRSTGQLNGIALSGGISAHTLSTTEQLTLQRDGNVWREIRGTMPTATLTDATESTTLPATTSSTLAALLQTVRNCLKWILARMDFRTAAVTIYVRTDGNDANAGFTNSAAGAVASWDGVFEVLRTLNMRNANVTIAFQAGTWPGATLCEKQFAGPGTGKLYITGIEGSTFFSSNVVVDNLWTNFANCTFQAGVYSRYNGWLGIYNCAFVGAATVGACIVSQEGGIIYVATGLSFSGAFTYGMYAEMFGSIRTENALPVTFKNSCSFSNYFLMAGTSNGPGTINLRGTLAYTGTFTGGKYYIQYGGKITGKTKADLDALPGTVAGIISAGAGITQSGQFISRGTTSASGYLLADGTDLSAAIAPKPQTATGIGQWGGVHTASNTATLPAGGTWAWYSDTADPPTGISAGGTTVTVGGAAVRGARFQYWRIA